MQNENENENKKNTFLKTDENKIINEVCIRWVKKMNDCLYICTKSNGCFDSGTHKVCKYNSFESYEKINKYFE